MNKDKQLKKQKLEMLQAFSHTNEVACRILKKQNL